MRECTVLKRVRPGDSTYERMNITLNKYMNGKSRISSGGVPSEDTEGSI